MNIMNSTSYPLIAFCWHTEKGYGDDVTIQPNQSANVSGPYVGEMGGGKCYVNVLGRIVCTENPEDEDEDAGVFQVSKGNILAIQSFKKGVTVRHHLDERDI